MVPLAAARRLFALAMVASWFGAVIVAQQVDVTQLGPQVGERIPDFSLVDHRGVRQTPGSLSGPNGLMLVFFRSADW